MHQSVTVQEEIVVTVMTQEIHYLGKQLSVLVPCLFTGCIFGILLYGPDSPQQHIRMLYLINLELAGHTFDKVAYGLLCGIHHTLKLTHLFQGQSKTRQRYEHITCTALEPRVTGQYVMMTTHFVVELVCGILETVIEVVTRSTLVSLNGERAFQTLGLYLRQACREHYALTLLYGHFKIAGHVEVLIELISALKLLGILKLAVPVRAEHKLVLLAELHVQLRVSGIHGGLYSVFHLFIVPAGVAVLMRKLTYAAESQEGLETQCRIGMRIKKRISYKYAVFIVLKEFLFL